MSVFRLTGLYVVMVVQFSTGPHAGQRAFIVRLRNGSLGLLHPDCMPDPEAKPRRFLPTGETMDGYDVFSEDAHQSPVVRP